MKTFRNALGGTLGLIAAVISITPQLSKDAGIIMDAVYEYVPQWEWAVISVFIFLGLLVWNKVEDVQESKKMPFQKPSKSQSHTGSGDNVGGDKHVYIGIKEKVKQQEPKKPKLFDITPSVIKNEKWLSVVVPNPTSSAIECYCVLKYVELDGSVDEKTKRYITAHTSRISWSGGDTVGKGEGVKLIDEENMLNVVSPTNDGLGFEMAKGTRYLKEDRNYGVGKYKVGIEINYCNVGETELQSKLFDVNFACYIEKSKIVDENMASNILRQRIGPQIFIGNDWGEYLYVEISRP